MRAQPGNGFADLYGSSNTNNPTITTKGTHPSAFRDTGKRSGEADPFLRTTLQLETRQDARSIRTDGLLDDIAQGRGAERDHGRPLQTDYGRNRADQLLQRRQHRPVSGQSLKPRREHHQGQTGDPRQGLLRYAPRPGQQHVPHILSNRNVDKSYQTLGLPSLSSHRS